MKFDFEISISFGEGLSDVEKNELIDEKFRIKYNFNSEGVWDDGTVPKTSYK